MDIEKRLETLEKEFQATREELNRILLDIRSVLMEAQSPLRADLNVEELAEKNDQGKEG